MTSFRPITMEWQGKSYTIPATRVLRAIAAVEEIVTLEQLSEYHKAGKAPIAKLAMAYAAVLNQAGCEVTDADVYAGIFSDDTAAVVVASVQTLLALMLPPNIDEIVKKELSKAANNGKNAKGGGVPLAMAASSKRPTKSQSSRASGSLRRNSGN